MKFATFSTLHSDPKPAVIKDNRIYPLPFADMRAVIEAGADEAARRASNESFALGEVKLHSPLRPTTLRDGYAFETHVKTANANRGREVPEEWYKYPIFYFTNPNNVFGQDDVIPYPPY